MVIARALAEHAAHSILGDATAGLGGGSPQATLFPADRRLGPAVCAVGGFITQKIAKARTLRRAPNHYAIRSDFGRKDAVQHVSAK
jgi:hypothetical protein